MSLMAGPISPALTPDGILLSPSINIIVKRQAFPSQRKWKSLSHVQLFVTPWTVVHGILQARILKWVAYLFSSRSSQARNRTRVSCIAERFFTNWAIREARSLPEYQPVFSEHFLCASVLPLCQTKSFPQIYEIDGYYFHLTAEKSCLERLTYLLEPSLTTGSSSDSKAHTSHSTRAIVITQSKDWGQLPLMLTVWRNIFGPSFFASEDDHFPEENSCPLYVCDLSQSLLLTWWSHFIQSCFQNSCFSCYWKVRLMIMPRDFQFFLYHLWL